MMDGKKLDHPVVRAANIFLISYAGILVASILLLTIDNYDFINQRYGGYFSA